MGDVEENPDLYEALAGNFPDPLPRDSFVLSGSDANAFLDLDQEGRDKFVNQHIDERSACSWVDIKSRTPPEPPELEVSYIYAPES